MRWLIVAGRKLALGEGKHRKVNEVSSSFASFRRRTKEEEQIDAAHFL